MLLPHRSEGDEMAKNSKQTSEKVAHIASEVLRDERSSSKTKTLAASALAQARRRKK